MPWQAVRVQETSSLGFQAARPFLLFELATQPLLDAGRLGVEHALVPLSIVELGRHADAVAVDRQHLDALLQDAQHLVEARLRYWFPWRAD